MSAKSLIFLEREKGFEPSTFSLGICIFWVSELFCVSHHPLHYLPN